MKRLLFILITIIAFALCGCDTDIQIMETKKNPNSLVSVKDKDMKNNQYYVKDNTDFYAVYMPEGNSKNMSSTLNESRVMCIYEKESLVPTHYINELIAYTSNELKFNNVTLERYKCLGYSFGVYGGIINSDGYLYYNNKQTLVPNTSIYNLFNNESSKDIRIASIDGKELSEYEISQSSGIICNLTKDNDYTIGYYAGTVYKEATVKADTQMFQAYEMYFYDSEYLSDTPNGYKCFETPTDLKSGYYNINGSGLFRYYAFEKSTNSDLTVDMNESYYKDEKSKLEAYSRQYNINIPNRVKDLKIEVLYNKPYEEDSTFVESSIAAFLFAPDNTKYEFEKDEKNKKLVIKLAEASAGDWTANVVPKTLDIIDVVVDSTNLEEDTTLEEKDFFLPENEENVIFSAEYHNDGEVFGDILCPDGKTYDMESIKEKDGKNERYYLKCEIPFLQAGTYKVRIYHHPEETTIDEPVMEFGKETKTDIIVIEG